MNSLNLNKDKKLDRQMVRQALKAWGATQLLGEQPLAKLLIVEERRQAAGYSDTLAGHGLALREVLLSAIETFKPKGELPNMNDRRWRSYALLKEHFLNNRNPEAIISELHTSRQTYYNEQNLALQGVADILSQWEEQSFRSKHVLAQADIPDVRVISSLFLAPPRPAYRLIGRDPILSQLKQELLRDQNTALSALQGLPGVGKTALAIELAHDADVRAHFSDGVLWAGLGRQPDVRVLLGEWAAAVGVPPETIAKYTDCSELVHIIYRAIGNRRMLLVIDDAWNIEAALAFKVGGERCAHLLTTRLSHLAVDFAGEGVAMVHELNITEGLQLLARMVPGVMDVEAAAAQALVEAVGSLPLALILMGKYLQKLSRQKQLRRIRQGLTELRQAQHRLQLIQPLSPLEKHPALPIHTPISLQTIISISDTNLDAVARRALRSLVLFPPKPNTFTEEAAIAVAAVSVNVIDVLVDHGVMESVGTDRYTLHQTISDYARLDPSDPGAQQRFVAYWSQYLTANSAADDRLSLELNNMTAALDIAFESEEPLFYGLVTDLTSFWLRRGLHSLAVHELSRALDRLAENQLAERYVLLLAREKSYDLQAERAVQGQDLVALERIASALRDERRQAEIALRQANYRIMLSDYPAAIRAAQRAVVLAEVVDDPESAATGYLQLGRVSVYQSNYLAGREHFERVLDLARTHQLAALEVRGLINLSVIALKEGKLSLGTTYLEQARHLCIQIHDRRNEGVISINLGIRAMYSCDYTAARLSLEQAARLFHDLGDRDNEAIALAGLGDGAQDLGNYLEAQMHYGQALAIACETGNRLFEGSMLENIGSILRQIGQYAEGCRYVEQSLALVRDLGCRHNESVSLNELSWSELFQGNYAQALDLNQQALELARAVGAQGLEATVLLLRGHVLAAAGRWDEAANIYQRVLALCQELEKPISAIEARSGWAQVSLQQGCLALAQTQVDEILAWLKSHKLDGANDQFGVYLTCYSVLKANHDPQAMDVLATAYNIFQDQLAKFETEAFQRSYSENIPSHRALLAAWSEAQKDKSPSPMLAQKILSPETSSSGLGVKSMSSVRFRESSETCETPSL